jgi:hypothetical protein
MNDPDNTQDRALTTDQIAAAGTGPARDDVPVMADNDGYADEGDGYTDENVGYADNNEGYPHDSQRYEGDNAGGLVADPAVAGQAVQGTPDVGDRGTVPAGRGSRASLLEDGELRGITMRWKDIQAEFVDEPQKAVQEADALVAELMQRLAVMFANERAELENRWAGGDQVSTEDLRQGLRRYRSFFERLLAA